MSAKFLMCAMCAVAIAFGCSESDRGNIQERVVISRLHNISDAVRAALTLRSNLNDLARSNMSRAITVMAADDRVLDELLTKRTGGQVSLAIVSTNGMAWTDPKRYEEEIAVILPDRVRKGTNFFFIGIRFSGELVYFASLNNK